MSREVDVAGLPTTFGEALRCHAAERPDAVALRFGDRVTTWREFDEQANRIANALIAMGLTKGDRVAYVGKNSDRAIALTLGASRAGVVFVPIIWRLAPTEIEYILADSSARVLFVEPAFAPIGASAARRGVTVIDVEAEYDAMLQRGAPEPPAVAINEQDVLLQLYTSGTTGKPKGVMLTHANGIRQRANQIRAGVDWLLTEPGDTTVVAMPYGHIGGVGFALLATNGGQEMIVHAEFDPGAVIEAVERHRVKRIFLVPAAIAMLLQHPRAAEADFSSIETLSYGASPIPLPLLQQAVDRMGCGFVQAYGMTETWGTVVALPPEDHLPGREAKMSAAGKALPGVELRIIDEDGKPLPPGTIGEIAISSPNNMAGYWKKPEETAATMYEPGWIRTGDAGLIDEDGYLFIQDRIKDMIITGAENVYPAEVESALHGHPAVLEAAVIGVPDAKWGEAVKAMVVLKPGAVATPDELIAHARTRIAGFKCPKSVDFIPALPRNPSGKILRRELREPFWAGHDRRVN